MKAQISVIVPTNRIGGLDVVFSGLARQTMKEFELVLVDNLLPRRQQLVARMARAYDISCKHVEPLASERSSTSGMVPQGQYQRSLNTGIVHSEGKIVVILCDYTYLAHDCLAQHLDFHDNHPGESCMGTLKFVKPPAVHPDLPLSYGFFSIGYDPAVPAEEREATYRPWLDEPTRLRLLETWRTNYERDFYSGLLDPFMWSAYGIPVLPSDEPSTWKIYHHEKIDLPEGLHHHQFCNLKNNSFLTKDLLDVNGLNETMDGSHVHQDSELAGRMEAKLKTKFRLVHSNLAYFFDPHGIAIIRRMEKPEAHNLNVYSRQVITRFADKINNWNLREKRELILGEGA